MFDFKKMKIFVHVKPGAREESVLKVDENHFTVKVKERPEKGRANEAVIKVIAGHFDVPSGRVKIVSGFHSRRKIISVG